MNSKLLSNNNNSLNNNVGTLMQSQESITRLPTIKNIFNNQNKLDLDRVLDEHLSEDGIIDSFKNNLNYPIF